MPAGKPLKVSIAATEQDWCISAATPGASADLNTARMDGQAGPDDATLAFTPAAAPGTAPQDPVTRTPIMMSGLPMTPGGGVQSPAARLLLSAMRPGWSLDHAAGVSTPYVEQLLRTLPVLTPETGGHTAWHRLPFNKLHAFYW